MRLEFRHLDVLVAIEETGSADAAARRLGISQQQLTRQLRRVEEHLGCAVFHRASGRLDPTAAGREVLALARQALRAVDGLPGRHRNPPSSLRLLHDRVPLPAVLPALCAAWPQLRPTLAFAPPEEAYRSIAAGRADVFAGLALPHAPWPSRGDLVETGVLDDPLAVHLSGHHRLAHQPGLRLHDLADDDWITIARTDARRATVAECRSVGGFEPRLVYEVADHEQVRALLDADMGVVLGSTLAPPGNGVASRSYPGASSARWVLAADPHRADPALTSGLAQLLRDRFSPSGTGPAAAGP